MKHLYLIRLNKIKKALALFLFIAFIIVILFAGLKSVLANTYGGSIYGDGKYGEGLDPSSSATSPPSDSSLNQGTDITIDGVGLSTTSTTDVYTQYPTISGKTEPFAEVTIEIDLILIGKVAADKDGYWSYTFTSPLDWGEHTIKISIETIDSKTNIFSQEYKINVLEKTTDTATATPLTSTTDERSYFSKNKNTIIGISALTLSLLIYIGILVRRSRRKNNFSGL